MKEAHGKSSNLEEYDEEPTIQKDDPTEQQAGQPVPGILKARLVDEDNHRKTDPDINPSWVNTNAQSVLERVLKQSHKPAPIPSYFQQLSTNESEKDPLTTSLATNQELSEYKTKFARQAEELKAANVRFEILQHHFSSLMEELQGYYRENPAKVFEEIRGRLEAIESAVKTNPVGSEAGDRNFSVNGEKPAGAESRKSVSFSKFPKRRDDVSPDNSPVKAEKAKMSVFSRFSCFASFFKIFERGESSSQSNPSPTGSNTNITDPTNSIDLPTKQPDIGENRQTLKKIGTTAALRELARKSLRQNSLILSKLNGQKQFISSSSSSHPLLVSTLLPPTENRIANNVPLIFLYTANIVLFLTFLVAIAWALAAGFMADSERRMWLAGGETARLASVLLEPEGGFWEKGWGAGAGGWGLGGDLESLKRGYF